MDLNEANKLWFTSQPIEGILFGLNDSVRIISGEHKGKSASVISLISLAPVIYLVELADWNGGDLEIPQDFLESYE
jgi:hypothetical protein